MTFVILILLVLFLLSRQFIKAPLPVSKWKFFKVPGAVPLDDVTGKKLEGVYSVKRGRGSFGELVVLKWSCILINGQPSYRLSFFFENDAAYFICEGRKTRHQIILHGYWSRPFTSETGEVSLVIRRLAGAGKLLKAGKKVTPWAIIMKGRFWSGGLKHRMVLRYSRPLNTTVPFEILGHRGAGRNIDFLPASENSLELIKMSPALGATGVEIDVNRTADKELVLFHDAVLSIVSIENYYQVRPISAYTYEELQNFRLKKGEKIPTLREALATILHETSLSIVWLDIKYDGDLQPVHALQQEFLQKAKEMGRKLQIYIGIPDHQVLYNFKMLNDYKPIPSLTELEPEIVNEINADVWAPKWTGGLRTKEALEMRSNGVKAFTWTVDDAEDLVNFLRRGKYDGILTNFPTLLAYYYYTTE